MKKLTESILLSLSILTLSACSASIPENWDSPQSESAPESESSEYSIPEYHGSDTEYTTAAAFVPNLQDCVSVNLNILLGGEIEEVVPLDGRYLAATVFVRGEWIDDGKRLYFTVDTATDPWEAVLSESPPPSDESEPEYDSETGAYTYTMGSHTIRQIGYNDIYEDIDGELTPLLLHTGNDEIDCDTSAVSYRYCFQIDDNSFVYGMWGHERTWGFGIYDLSKHERRDAPDTDGLSPVAIRNGVIFSLNEYYPPEMPSLCVTDTDTLETRRFPDDEVFRSNDGVLEMFTLSENGRILTFTQEDYLKDAVYTVYVINADDGGSVIWSREFRGTDIGIDLSGVYFFGEDKLLLLSGAYCSSSTYYDKYAHIIPIQ